MPKLLRTGVDMLLEERRELVHGRTCGLVTNAGAVTRRGIPTFQALLSAHDVHVAALFSPEHGLRADESYDAKTTKAEGRIVPVHDLYKERKRPTREQLEGLDTILFDLQGLGLRFYTYDSTLFHVMEAAAEADIPLVVLDRPEPLGGQVVEGPPLDPEFRSFVGIANVPVRHGMTMGELACWFNRYCMADQVKLDVVTCDGWRRGMFLDETGLPWARPSPGIRSWQTLQAYPATCFLEGTNVSEGRGTDIPFEQFGAPWIIAGELAKKLNTQGLPGIWFTEARFTPEYSKWKGEECLGCRLHITDRHAYRPLAASVHIIWAIRQLWPDRFAWQPTMFIDRLYGSDLLRKQLDGGAAPGHIVASWDGFLRDFQAERQACLMLEYRKDSA